MDQVDGWMNEWWFKGLIRCLEELKKWKQKDKKCRKKETENVEPFFCFEVLVRVYKVMVKVNSIITHLEQYGEVLA